MSKSTHNLRVSQLDRKLKRIRDLPIESKTPPRAGWIRAIRNALGMSGECLARRMNISQPAQTKYEKRERDKSITLLTLQKVADALDAEFVYAIVPRKPIREMLQDKATEKARERIRPLAHSMNLEDQGTADDVLESEVAELAKALMETPKKLWR
jgi:predicted DNA-binding mobile mystery protein A